MDNRARISCLFMILMCLFSTSLTAQQSTPDSNLSASLIVIGPGDPIYTYWGHIGIAIENIESGENLFYDFGNFSFYSDNFYSDFALGRMLYLGMATPTDVFLDYSMTENRDITIYPLNLDRESIADLDLALRRWMLPENREYLYEYFRNNCSTIIRDLLNQVTDGALKRATETIPDRSFRHYTRTGSHESPAAEIMLHFLLGPTEDKPISLWDKMFLPQAVADTAMMLEFEGKDGKRRRLISDAILLKKSTREPVPEEPRRLWPLMLVSSLLISTLGVVSRRKSGRIGTAYRAVIVMLVGLPGSVLAFLMLFTDHAAAYGNVNLWPSFPTVLLALIPLFGIGRLHGERRMKRESIVAWIWTVNLIGVVTAVVLSLSGVRAQSAGAFWVFYGPISFSFSQAGLWLERKYLKRAD